MPSTLGMGEQEVISIACVTLNSIAILDDLAARRAATRIGVDVIGTLGVLATMKNRGRIALVRPFADQLLLGGFRVSAEVYRRALQLAGEQ